MPENFAELIWINALNTNAVHGVGSGFYKHISITVHVQSLFSSLIHESIYVYAKPCAQPQNKYSSSLYARHCA